MSTVIDFMHEPLGFMASAAFAGVVAVGLRSRKTVCRDTVLALLAMRVLVALGDVIYKCYSMSCNQPQPSGTLKELGEVNKEYWFNVMAFQIVFSAIVGGFIGGAVFKITHLSKLSLENKKRSLELSIYLGDQQLKWVKKLRVPFIGPQLERALENVRREHQELLRQAVVVV